MVGHGLHRGLTAYLADRQAGQAVRNPDGSVSLVFDGQYRVACLAVANGDLLLEARVFELPADVALQESSVQELLEQVGQRLERQTEWMALTRDGLMLVLQQIVPAQADRMHFEAMLERFVNALAGWRCLAGVL